jgi:effector protein SdbA
MLLLQQNAESTSYKIRFTKPGIVKDIARFIVKIPILLPWWFVSLIVARLTINPLGVKKQKDIEFSHLSYDETDDNDIVIINACPPQPKKTIKDLFFKITRPVQWLWRGNEIRNSVSKKNTEHQAYIEQLKIKIRALKEGQFTECPGKTFRPEDIHLKGLEFLDHELRKELQDAVDPDQTIVYPFFWECMHRTERHHLQFFTLENQEGIRLDSVAVAGPGENNKPMGLRKFVIACMPRDENYLKWLKDFNHSANTIGCTVIGFNYRGVDRSRGWLWTQNNMINDVMAEANRLLLLGAKPENIGLEGTCIGGNIATLAAAKLHQEGKAVKLYNERSTRSIPRFLLGFLWPKSGNNSWRTLAQKCLAFLAIYLIVAPAQWFSGWRMNAADAWDKIPAKDKTYSVIRNIKKDGSEPTISDGVVEDSFASMASFIDEKRMALEQKKRRIALNEEERRLIDDPAESHYFNQVQARPNPPSSQTAETKATPKRPQRAPHHLPRRVLLQQQEGLAPRTLHDYAIGFFRQRLGETSSSSSHRPSHHI